jgi:hypothetical protein
MAQDRAAASGANSGKKPRRKWQRRPAARRPGLTPDEVAALEAEAKRLRRTKALHVQMTADEKDEVTRRAKAYKARVSDFARTVLLSDVKAPLPPVRDSEALNAFTFQLQKIGTNLNQLTKMAHEMRALPRVADLKAVTDKIVATLDKVYGP